MVKSAKGADDSKTLKSIKFQTGDYMDVAIMMPKDRERPPERERERERPAAPAAPRGRGTSFRNDRGAPPNRPWR